MAHTVVLIIHIAVGGLGVVLGPLAVARVARGKAGWPASAFHLAVALVCLSAVGLAALDFARLWWFVFIAAGSYAFAGRAMLAVGSARPGWPARAVRGFGGAYIALWTAVLVVSAPAQPIVWLIPTALGIVLVEALAVSVKRRTQAVAT